MDHIVFGGRKFVASRAAFIKLRELVEKEAGRPGQSNDVLLMIREGEGDLSIGKVRYFEGDAISFSQLSEEGHTAPDLVFLSGQEFTASIDCTRRSTTRIVTQFVG